MSKKTRPMWYTFMWVLQMTLVSIFTVTIGVFSQSALVSFLSFSITGIVGVYLILVHAMHITNDVVTYHQRRAEKEEESERTIRMPTDVEQQPD